MLWSVWKRWLAEEADHESAAEYPEYLRKLRKMAICLNKSSMQMKRSYSRSTCLLAHLLQKMRERPEATDLEKTSSKSCFGPMVVVTFWLSLCCFTDFKICVFLEENVRNTSVYMMGSHKIWITEKLLDCFLKCSVPEVKQYLNQKKIWIQSVADSGHCSHRQKCNSKCCSLG